MITTTSAPGTRGATDGHRYRAHGGIAVVTLEPCNHHSRTPPCHHALIDAGIWRVVVALLDPTSRGEGGVARLRQVGIEVEADVLADDARLVLGPWLHALGGRLCTGCQSWRPPAMSTS